MKTFKKICCAALIMAFLLSQAIMGSSTVSEAAGGTWKQDKNGWWYSYSDGSYAKNAWLKSGGKWYYFGANGYMAKNWQKIGGKWYYFGTDGAMKTGWQKVGGKWYFFTASGAMKTGWLSSGGKWYFFDGSGAMKTGWLSSGGKWYYFDSNGAMATGTRTIGGKTYTFGSDGAMKDGSSLANAKVGDIISYGHYEQDGKTSNGKEAIEWMVLDKNSKGQLYVVSRYALDYQPYNTANKNVTWETCSLRKWLNNTFYNAAFTDAEKAKIAATTLVNGKNEIIGTAGGNNTSDKVFLLSVDDSVKYFVDNKGGHSNGYCDSRLCKATQYAISLGAGVYTGSEPKTLVGTCYDYWLRCPGYSQAYAAVVSGSDIYRGTIDYFGCQVNVKCPIRPAMWITP